MEKRYDWVDIAKAICFLCVIYSHLETSTPLLMEFINPFFLVVFFFCAGYCYKYKLSFKDFLYRKFRKLFIPWLFFSYANIGLSYIKSFKPHINITDELIRNALQIRGYDDKLWFIAAMFVCYIPFYFVVKYTEDNKKKKIEVFVVLLLMYFIKELYSDLLPTDTFPWKSSSLPWHIEYIPKGVFFMYLGYYYRMELQEKLSKCNNIFVFMVICFLYFMIAYFVRTNNYYLSVVLKIAEHILATVFIMMLSKRIKMNKYLRFVGSNTLIYFCIHNKASTLMEVILEKIIGYNTLNFISSNEIYSNVYAVLLTLIISVLLIIPTTLINKYCTKILGKDV